MNLAIPFALMLVAISNSGEGAPASTREAVVAGMKCEQNTFGSMECEYQVGRSLHFAVVGVGDEDAAITFYAASFDGDYYARVGVQHGCVIVKPGQAAKGSVTGFAFVSPRNGKVYDDWVSCKDAK